MQRDSNTRIIGDFLEVNADIVQYQFNSKLPKFIAKYKANKLRNRLIKSINRLRESDMILSVYNVSEYLNYIYNEYENGTYKSISMIKKMNNLIEAVLKIDNINCIISVDSSEGIINIVLSQAISDDFNKGCNLTLKELSSIDPESNKQIKIVNNTLKKELFEFVLDLINRYK